MIAAKLTASGEGRCSVSGHLTLETAAGLWQQLKAGGLLAGAREADLLGVTDADSAGLAMLLAWRSQCLAAGNSLALHNLPPRIVALAQLTGAEAALGATETG
jgi:phospholipid transport system transporter-binding protein